MPKQISHNNLQCVNLHLCGGCRLARSMSFSEQIEHKKLQLLELLNSCSGLKPSHVNIISGEPAHERSRFDFIIKNNDFGLYSQNGENGYKQFIPIDSCPQSTRELIDWYKEFKSLFHYPIGLGSVRLRILPDNSKAAWLDFSNKDIKGLLEEKSTLLGLLKIAKIEAGQKNKFITLSDDLKLKLKEIDPLPIFKTIYKQNEIVLKGWVSSFTQPSQKLNLIVMDKIQKLTEQFSVKNIFEFGCGIGNLTFPLLASAQRVESFEIESRSLDALKMTLAENKLTDQCQLQALDLYRAPHLNLASYDLVCVNPPRSGLKQFTDIICQNKCKNLLYMSCNPQTLIEDIQRLQIKSKVEILDLTLIDQFPNSTHFEVLIWLKLNY